MDICLIACIGRNNELGEDGKLIWNLAEDMANFKKETKNNIVVMGRKTWDSLPVKPLPDRINIIMTRDQETSLDIEYDILLANDIEDVQVYAGAYPNKKVFIIGGSEIYSMFLPIADEMILTHIDDSCNSADTFFPKVDYSQWNKQFVGGFINGFYSINKYRRKNEK